MQHWRGIAQAGIITAGVIGGGLCVASVVCAGAVGIIGGPAAIGAAVGAGTYAVSSQKHTARGYLAQTGLGAVSGAVGGAYGATAAGLGLKFAASALGGMTLGAAISGQAYDVSTPEDERDLGDLLYAMDVGALEASPFDPKVFGFGG